MAENSPSKLPIASRRAGEVSVAVWKHPRQDGSTFYSGSIQRRTPDFEKKGYKVEKVNLAEFQLFDVQRMIGEIESEIKNGKK
jgi:hypothetical protein